MEAAKFLRICGINNRDLPSQIDDYQIELDADVVVLRCGRAVVGRYSERNLSPRCVLTDIRQDIG